MAGLTFLGRDGTGTYGHTYRQTFQVNVIFNIFFPSFALETLKMTTLWVIRERWMVIVITLKALKAMVTTVTVMELHSEAGEIQSLFT